MNKNVLKTLIGLTIAYLIAWYILKIFFPEKFILQVNNERLIAIGTFIDNHFIINHLCGIITSYITYWLYLGAVCKIKRLNWKQSLVVVGIYILGIFVEMFDVVFSTYYSILAMIIYPAILKAEYRKVVIVLCFHIICQCLSVSIRNLSAMVLSFNFLSLFIMSLECYFWLFLFYVYFNFYNEENNYGN